MQKDTMQDNYLRSMQADRDLAKAYFAKSINKTEQQKALESLLAESIDSGILEKTKPYRIADLACGGGTLSYHLASFFPNATFCLMDYNDDALELAKEITSPFKDRVEFVQGDLRTVRHVVYHRPGYLFAGGGIFFTAYRSDHYGRRGVERSG